MKEIKGIVVLETLEEIADPKHTALLIIDVQNDDASPKGFLGSRGLDISWVRKTIPNIKRVIEEARRLGLLIIFTKVVSSRDGTHESGPWLSFFLKMAHLRGGTEGDWLHVEGT